MLHVPSLHLTIQCGRRRVDVIENCHILIHDVDVPFIYIISPITLCGQYFFVIGQCCLLNSSNLMQETQFLLVLFQ